MTLRPTLAGPCDLLHKLQREQVRAMHHEHPLHKADHFYNFCVTAWSMADYLAKHQGLDAAGREAAFAAWRKAPEIAAAQDVANTAKHFEITKYTPTTKAVRPGVSPVVKFYETPEGDLIHVLDEHAPSLRVLTTAGAEFELWQFMFRVVQFWRHELARLGIACPEQSADDLHGRTDERAAPRETTD